MAHVSGPPISIAPSITVTDRISTGKGIRAAMPASGRSFGSPVGEEPWHGDSAEADTLRLERERSVVSGQEPYPCARVGTGETDCHVSEAVPERY